MATRRRHGAPASLLLILLLCASGTAQLCGRRARHLPCGGYRGLRYQVNEHGRIVEVENLAEWKALVVPRDAVLSMTLCNYGNVHVNDVTIRNRSLVPSLVAAVGRNATVRVNIFNSGNLDVSKRLVIGFALSEKRHRSFEYNDTSIIDKVVRGPVSDGASIFIDVEHSGNVRLRKGTRDLRLGKATLLNELINASHRQDMHCLTSVCFETRVEHSANVYAEERGVPDVSIQDAQLEDESVDTGCIGAGSFVRVAKRNVSNVVGVRTLHIWDGELSDEAVDALHIKDAEIEVSVRDTGNVWADHVRIMDGELVDEMVDARDVSDSEIRVTLRNVANVEARSIDMFNGELLDEVFDARDLLHSDIAITLTDVANVRVSKLLSLSESELVDELIDVNTINAGTIDVRLERTASVLCSAGSVSLSNSELLETILDTASVHHVRAAIYIKDTANIHVRDNWLHFSGSVLARPPYDVDLMNTGVRFTKVTSMENMCARCPGSTYACAGTSNLMVPYVP